MWLANRARRDSACTFIVKRNLGFDVLPVVGSESPVIEPTGNRQCLGWVDVLDWRQAERPKASSRW